MGSIPEVKERTEMIKREPFQFLHKLLNEDTNSISISFNYNIINTGINDTLTIDFE